MNTDDVKQGPIHYDQSTKNTYNDGSPPSSGDGIVGMLTSRKALTCGAVGVAAVTVAPLAVSSLGFGAAGITAGSAASKLMSVAATSGYGMGVVSTLQSAGAVGFGVAAKTLIGAGGVLVGRSITEAAAVERNTEMNIGASTSQGPNPSVECAGSSLWGTTVTKGKDVVSTLQSAGALCYELVAKAWNRGGEPAVVSFKPGASDVNSEKILAHSNGNAGSSTHEITGINAVGVVSAIQSVGLAAKGWTSSGAAAIGVGIMAALNRNAANKKENNVSQEPNASEVVDTENISHLNQKAAYKKSKL